MKIKQLFEQLREKPLEDVLNWASKHKGMLFHGSRNKFSEFKSHVKSQDLGVHFASDAALASHFTHMDASSDWSAQVHDGTHHQVKRTGIGGFIIDLMHQKYEKRPSYLYAVDSNGLKYLDLRPLMKESDIIEWSYHNLLIEFKWKGVLYDLFPSLKGMKKKEALQALPSLIDSFEYDGFIYDNVSETEMKNASDSTCYLVFNKSLDKLSIQDVYEVDPMDHEGQRRKYADTKRLDKLKRKRGL